jgi:hypothetical protein
MLRRKFLATAALGAMAPVSCATAGWCGSYYDGDGWVKKWCEPTPPQWDGYRQFNSAYEGVAAAIGAKPMPGNAVFVPREQVGYYAQLNGTEYSDFGDLADLISVGYAVGGAYGFMRAGPRGSVVAGTLVAGTLALGWLAYNASVVMYKYPTSILGEANPSPASVAAGTPLTLHGTNAGSLSGGLPAGASITGGIGSGGWLVIRLQ